MSNPNPALYVLKKRLLIMSQWAPPMIGGPQNLYNLFSQVDPNTYSVITSQKNLFANSAVATGSRLDCPYYYYDTQATRQISGTVKKSIVWKVLRLLKHYVLGWFIFLRDIYRLTTCATALVRKTDSKMLMGISDNGISLIGTFFVSLITRKPYTIYLFDLYRGNLLTGIHGLTAKVMEGMILRRAKLVILTNEETKDYYKRRYGDTICTAIIYNSNFPEPYETLTYSDPRPPFTIVFTGSVGWPQEQSVLNLLQAMEYLKDLDVRLDLYIPTPPKTILKRVTNSSNIRLLAAPQADMPKIQHNASLLFLPLAWNTKAPDIIATATPGKFTDYLASHRPMIIHAPAYAYVSKYTRMHHCGIVVDTNAPKTLAEAIRQHFSNPAEGSVFVENAVRCFRENHDARINAGKLTELLNMI